MPACAAVQRCDPRIRLATVRSDRIAVEPSKAACERTRMADARAAGTVARSTPCRGAWFFVDDAVAVVVDRIAAFRRTRVHIGIVVVAVVAADARAVREGLAAVGRAVAVAVRAERAIADMERVAVTVDAVVAAVWRTRVHVGARVVAIGAPAIERRVAVAVLIHDRAEWMNARAADFVAALCCRAGHRDGRDATARVATLGAVAVRAVVALNSTRAVRSRVAHRAIQRLRRILSVRRTVDAAIDVECSTRRACGA